MPVARRAQRRSGSWNAATNPGTRPRRRRAAAAAALSGCTVGRGVVGLYDAACQWPRAAEALASRLLETWNLGPGTEGKEGVLSRQNAERHRPLHASSAIASSSPSPSSSSSSITETEPKRLHQRLFHGYCPVVGGHVDNTSRKGSKSEAGCRGKPRLTTLVVSGTAYRVEGGDPWWTWAGFYVSHGVGDNGPRVGGAAPLEVSWTLFIADRQPWPPRSRATA